jgi:prepilin-type N-terminal cleavage/methylation domain-containing protein
MPASSDSQGVTRRLRAQAGFSLVEVLAAMLILALAAGAAFTLIDSANRSVSSNNARIAATNLQRELAEYARGTDYDLLQPSQAVPALRKHGAIQGTLAGSVWKIERRGVTYSVSTDVCTFDDPKDGLAATPPANACPAAAAVAGAPTEVNPDDFRKITFAMTWTARGRSGKATQSTLIVNPAGALGPRITEFGEPTFQITTGSQSWGPAVTYHLKSTSASAVHWTTDDLSGGDATGGPTDWSFTWNLGTRLSSPLQWVRDGTYTIQAQAFDGRGVPGEAKIVTVHINRGDPAAVSGLAAGYNPSRNVVDIHWSRYDERDLQGYVVYRNADGKQICPGAGALTDKVSCTDTDPLDLSTYSVYAADCKDLYAGTDCTNLGAAATTQAFGKSTPPSASTLDKPTGLTATVVDGKPTLTWTAPPAAPGDILLYRIYRDTGTGLADRYDETVTSATTYTDPNPGSTTAHTYWVTAVDTNFNEGPASDPVVSPPLP